MNMGRKKSRDEARQSASQCFKSSTCHSNINEIKQQHSESSKFRGGSNE